MKHVQNVRGKWVARVTVPEHLRDIIGVRELVHRDLPSDTRKRERLAHGILNGFFARIEDAENEYAARQSAPDPTLSMLAKAHYASVLDADTQKRASMPTPEEIEAERERALDILAERQRNGTQTFTTVINDTADFELKASARACDQNVRQRRLSALKSSFTTGETRWIAAAVEQYILERGLKIIAGSKEWREIADALTRAEIDALERTCERDLGNFGGAPRDPLLTTLEPETVEDNYDGVGMPLTEALKLFHEERKSGKKPFAPRTIEEHKNAVRMFNEFMGSDPIISSITKKHVVQYKGALLKTPNRYTMRFLGLTLAQAITANEKRSEPFATLCAQTINTKWLSHLSSILSWAAKNAHIVSNPALGVVVDNGKKAERPLSYQAFTKSELALIFGHSMFSDPSEYGRGCVKTLHCATIP